MQPDKSKLLQLYIYCYIIIIEANVYSLMILFMLTCIVWATFLSHNQ